MSTSTSLSLESRTMADHQTPDADPRPYPAIYRNLMSVALLGTMYRVGEDAEIISHAVELTLEESGSFAVYRAVALAMAGRLDHARETLGASIENDPQDDASKVALAIAMLFGGDPGWRHWIDNVLATSADVNVRQAAHGVLGYLGKLSRMH
jgi:hypothetical protein